MTSTQQLTQFHLTPCSLIHRPLFSHPSLSQIFHAFPSQASYSLCLKRLGYKITKTVKKTKKQTFGPDGRSHYTSHMLLFLSSTVQQLLLLHQHPSTQTWKKIPPLAPLALYHWLQGTFAFLFSASSSLRFSFKRGQQASLSVAPPAMYLQQKSSHSPWEHPNKLFPSSFALIWPRCCQPYFSFPIGFHSASICLSQIQHQKSSCFPTTLQSYFN